MSNREQSKCRKYHTNETLTSDIYSNHKHQTASRATSQLRMLNCSSSTSSHAQETNSSNDAHILPASFLPFSTSLNSLSKVMRIDSDSEEEGDCTFGEEQMKVIKWFEILTDNGDSLCFDTFDLFEEWKNNELNKWKQKYRSNYKTRDSVGKHIATSITYSCSSHIKCQNEVTLL